MITDTELSIEQLRLLVFLLVAVLLLVAERLWSRRPADAVSSARRLVNVAMLCIATVAVKLIPLATATGAAVWAKEAGWGAFHWLDWPGASLTAILLGLVLLDCAIYWQHRLMHRIPLLWRMHRLHHSDVHLDVTTALRFHPLEILLSVFYKMALVALLGLPVITVVLFEILLNALAMFNHANLKLRGDKWLRLLLVTPDMHRVHHSVKVTETNSNYGFCLPYWDWIFGSYQAQPEAGHSQMRLGLDQFREQRSQKLSQLLLNPFRKND